MAIFGLRTALKSGLKRALGREDARPSQTSPWETASAPPQHDDPPAPAAQAEPAAPAAEEAPVEPAAEPAAVAADAGPEAAEAEAEASAGDATPTMDPTDDTAGPPITFEAVQEILDDMVRPALQGDGGDITLLRVEDNNIHVKLVGACSTCPSSVMTMKMGVEALLREEFPGMKDLVQEES